MFRSDSIITDLLTPLVSLEELDIQFSNGLWLDQVFRIISSLMVPGENTGKILKEIEWLCFDCDELNTILFSETEPDHHSCEEDYLISGKLYTLDISFKKEGYWIDGARTYKVGPVDVERHHLWDFARLETQRLANTIEEGISFKEVCIPKPGMVCEGIYLASGFGGHGIGRSLHEREDFFYDTPHSYIFKSRDCLTVEPVFWKNIDGKRVYLYFEITLFLMDKKKSIMPLATLERD